MNQTGNGPRALKPSETPKRVLSVIIEKVTSFGKKKKKGEPII